MRKWHRWLVIFTGVFLVWVAATGPVGKAISALLGAAMLFFSVSGMWMYVDMFRKRKDIGRPGIFWK